MNPSANEPNNFKRRFASSLSSSLIFPTMDKGKSPAPKVNEEAPSVQKAKSVPAGMFLRQNMTFQELKQALGEDFDDMLSNSSQSDSAVEEDTKQRGKRIVPSKPAPVDRRIDSMYHIREPKHVLSNPVSEGVFHPQKVREEMSNGVLDNKLLRTLSVAEWPMHTQFDEKIRQAQKSRSRKRRAGSGDGHDESGEGHENNDDGDDDGDQYGEDDGGHKEYPIRPLKSHVPQSDVAGFNTFKRILDAHDEESPETKHDPLPRYTGQVVTREYEEAQMCEALHGKRSCVNGDGCICKQWFGFMMKEFVLPVDLQREEEEAEEEREHKKKLKHQLNGDGASSVSEHERPVGRCLLCLRACNEYLARRTSHSTQIFNQLGPLIPMNNLFLVEGEYCMENAVITPTTARYFVANFRDGYKVEMKDGVRWITQPGYPIYTVPYFH